MLLELDEHKLLPLYEEAGLRTTTPMHTAMAAREVLQQTT